jgi:serine/threonine protein phosphatase PrpC
MNCSACGADNREGARFCRDCGQRLVEEATPVPAEQQEKEGVAEEGRIEPQPEEDILEEPTSPGLPAAGEPPASAETAGASGVQARPATKTDREPPLGDEAVGGKAELTFYDEIDFDEPVDGTSLDEEALDAVVEETDSNKSNDLPAPAVKVGEEEGDSGTVTQTQPGPTGEPKMADGESLDSEDDFVAFWREEPEQMIPVEVGTVIEDRYAVVETLDVQEDEILYRALDLRRCWQCGHEENDPEGAFCARCGVLMDRRPDVELMERRQAKMDPPPGKIAVARIDHDSRHFLLLAEQESEPEHKPEMPPKPTSYRLLVGQRSDPGQVRELDEDSLFVLTLAPTYQSRTGPSLGLFAVADGMGGHAGGEVASKMALQVLVERVLQTMVLSEISGELVLEEDILALLRQATIAANDDVYLARKKRDNDMGTTLSTVFIRDDRLFLAHVGDGRVYRFSAEGLEQLTTDHSVVASMIAEGQAKPEELYTHPHRSIIYRCIGDKPVVEVDTDILPLTPGDRIILCCDGVWETLRDQGIEDVMMQEADPQAACDLLVRRANAAGGDDNISVIVVQVDSIADIDV